MRTATRVAICTGLVLLGALLPLAAELDTELALLEDALAESSSRAEKLELLARLLEALESAGESSSYRYHEVLDQALALDPGNPQLLRARAEVHLALGEVDRAILDLETALAADLGDEKELTLELQRGLSELYAETSRFEEQIALDRVLLESDEERRLETLGRLARAYARTGQLRSAREALRSVMIQGSDAERFDPELSWLEASLSARVDPPEEAQANLLRFAAVHPGHASALVARRQAAEIAHGRGEIEGALLILGDIERSEELDDEHARARLLRARCLAALGRDTEALEAWDSILRLARAPETLLEAMTDRFDFEVEQGGIRSGIHLLADMAVKGEGFVHQLAVTKLGEVLRGAAKRLAQTPEDALYFARLADRSGAADLVPSMLRIEAARLAESVGAAELAVEQYSAVSRDLGAEGREARESLVRLGIEDVPLVREQRARVLRSEYLEAVDRREELIEDLRVLRETGAVLDAESARRLARALLHDPAGAELALTVLADAGQGAEIELLRADALSLKGDRAAACGLYASITGSELGGEDARWLAERRARCERRSDTKREG